jgi:hypothetical protein
MYYVLAFHRCNQRLHFFYPLDNSNDAITARIQMERENTRAGIACEEIIAISAVDLCHLMRIYTRYFVNALYPDSIADCFFCRPYLGDRQKSDGIQLDQIQLLQNDAYRNGHCILCHKVYPVSSGAGHHDSATGLRLHIPDCYVLEAE